MDLRDLLLFIELFLVLCKDLLPFFVSIMVENGTSGFLQDKSNFYLLGNKHINIRIKFIILYS
jgi:hypothetical protein